MAKILITGANGTVGRSLMKHLGALNPIPVTRHVCDLTDPVLVRLLVEEHQPDVVIHCACNGGKLTLGEFHQQDLLDNIAIVDNICNVANEVRLIINIGSGAEYGLHNTIANVSEHRLHMLQLLNGPPRESYGLSKRLAWQRFEQLPNAMTLRLFGFFDPLEARFRLMRRFVDCMKSGESFVLNQDRAFSWFSGRDLALAIVEIIDRKLSWKWWQRSMPPTINMAYQDRSVRFLSHMLERWCLLNSISPKWTLDSPIMGTPYTCDPTLMNEHLKSRFHGLNACLGDYQ